MQSNLVFLGPPGAGKGTQARTLAQRKGIPHVSTGDLFREAVRDGTDLGREARRFLEEGHLVPDEIVCGLVREKLGAADAQDGFILDGFPRTTPQAEALDETLAEQGRRLDAVVCLVLEDSRLVERLTGRLTCRACGAMFHLRHNPPREQGACDACGGEVVTRKDDQEATILERLEEYHAKTEPLIKWYRDRGLLLEIPADGSIDRVQRALEGALAGG